MAIPAIIDCDPGHDDVMAILLGARTVDLKGITTVHGNASLEQTTRNARYTVELADLTDIPVSRGMANPFVRNATFAPNIHGKTGLDGPEQHTPTVDLHPLNAVDFINETARAHDNFHLFPVGPLTNVGTALRLFPDLRDHIAMISLMGGSLTFGNKTPAAEFNIWADAEAAHVVFTSGIPIKMIGLNVTREVGATADIRAKIRGMGSRTAIAVADMLDFYSARLKEQYGLDGGSMHDPLAVAAVIDDDVLTFEQMHVAIELKGEHTYGMTLCDYRKRRKPNGEPFGELPNAEVAVDVNVDRFWELFFDALSTYP